jgi:hypothetical protein
MPKFLFLPLLCMFTRVAAQYEPLARNAFMGREIQHAFDFWSISKPDIHFHSSFRPYLSSTYLNAADSVVPFSSYGFRNFFLARTLNEKPENRNWFMQQFLPIADAEAGFDVLTGRPVTSTLGGLHIKSSINNDFTFAMTFVAGRINLPFYGDTVLQNKMILPEGGQAYGKNGIYNYTDLTGYISYTTRNKVFNLQAGRDKHFIGDGYRSVLLSDYAPANPYFRITANIWKLQYAVWYSWLSDVSQANGIKSKFSNKYGTFHYLSCNIFKELSVGVFENVIWRGSDTNQSRTFDPNYLNPVVFYRPQEYSLGSADNSFLGANASAILFKKIRVYAQLGLDEFYLKEIRARRGWWANKQAWQFGLKSVNVFGVKGLRLQAEYNEVRPYTYSHGLPDQNYAHYGMPLAHPLGANFKEYLAMISLRRKNWEISWQGMFAVIGKDTMGTTTNMGQNIFASYTTRPYDYGHKTTQGEKHNLLQSQFRFTWYLIPQMNTRLEFGYIQRSEESKRYILQDPYIYVSFRTSFWNIYRDF